MITETLLRNISALPSLPAIAVKIIQEIRRDGASVGRLAEIISVDPALTAKLLKVANSSFYGLSQKVDSIERAVHILGLEAVKNIALSFVIVKGFKRNSIDGFDQELFWKQSITSAVCARMIASRAKAKSDDIFITALLMDIGVLVMHQVSPEDYLKVIDVKNISGISAVDAERSIFGFDHQEAGAYVLKEWGIPETIYGPIAIHHAVAANSSGSPDTAVILMLSGWASSVYYGSRSMEKLNGLNLLLQQQLHMTGPDVKAFIDTVAEKTGELLMSFDFDPSAIRPYSEMLHEAQEECEKRNLSYEQLAIELKLEKRKNERLAKELGHANEKLRKLSNRDDLTGIYSHRFFHEVLEKEMERAGRYSRNLSLVIFDIDHLKTINDSHGYSQGDIVLRAIAELLQQLCRKPDMAARYGGEEFAVLLPEAGIKGAIVLAERVRQMVERLEINIEGQAIKVTVSAGITMYVPSRNSRDSAGLIQAACKALHYSKVTGRNKFSVVPMAEN